MVLLANFTFHQRRVPHVAGRATGGCGHGSGIISEVQVMIVTSAGEVRVDPLCKEGRLANIVLAGFETGR